MTEDQINLLHELRVGRLSEDEFLSRYPVDFRNDPAYVPSVLAHARTTRDETELEYIIVLLDTFGCAKENSRMICQLIDDDWHERHEDLVSLQQFHIKDPDSVDCLYRAAIARFPYMLEDDNALAVKAIWALGVIGNAAAQDKLRLLERSDNREVCENAKEQLARIAAGRGG